MVRIKKGKNVRLPEAALPELEALREKMGRVTHIGGMLVNPPPVKLGDGLVISWALAMTNYLMNPKFSVIDTDNFTDRFFEQLEPNLADLASCTPDEVKARIRLLTAAAAQLGGYNTSDALRATSAAGETPS